MPRLYFAGPLFSAAELTFNAVLAEHIEALGFEVFLPQRDGVESRREPLDQSAADNNRVGEFANRRC